MANGGAWQLVELINGEQPNFLLIIAAAYEGTHTGYRTHTWLSINADLAGGGGEDYIGLCIH